MVVSGMGGVPADGSCDGMVEGPCRHMRPWRVVGRRCMGMVWMTMLLNGGVSAWAETGLTNLINHITNTVPTTWRVGTNGAFNALIITNAGQLRVTGDGVVGGSSLSSNNSVLISGLGSAWTNTGNFYLGATGAFNRLTIAAGGRVYDSMGYLGYTAGSGNNTGLVMGGGSLWNNSDGICIGYGGRGNGLILTNGGRAISSFGTLGYASTAVSNIVWVTGPGSVWSNTGPLTIGCAASRNSVIVSNGGSLFSSAGFVGSLANASFNSVLVTGSNSLWLNRGDLYVGSNSIGNSLTLSHGGVVLNTNAYLGFAQGAISNAVTVTDAGSLWANSGDLYIGYTGGVARLAITSGGVVHAANVLLGTTSSSTGNVLSISSGGLYATNTVGTGVLDIRRGTLTLSGGTLTTDRLVATNGASSVLAFISGTLLSGGTIVSNAAPLTIGQSGGDALLYLNGGTHLFCSALTVGRNSSNNGMLITNGAAVTSLADNLLGGSAGANSNYVYVGGGGARWNLSGQTLAIGSHGKAVGSTLTIATGGMVTNGVLELGGVGAAVRFNGGTLAAGTNGNWISGTGAMYVQAGGAQFNTADFTVTNLFPLVGDTASTGGGITKLGAGTLVLGGHSTYTGGTSISNGTLRLAGANALPVATTLYADTLGEFDLAGYQQMVDSINGYRGIVKDSIGGGLLIVVNGDSQNFYGRLSGAGALTLTGGGTLQLYGTNSFAGSTLVSNASYYVNGLHNGGVITAISNGRVSGSGSIGSLCVSSGGVFSPGNNIATQFVASLTLTNAGLLDIELGAQANDKLIVTNMLRVANGAELQLNLAAYRYVPWQPITILEWTGATGFSPTNAAQWFTLRDVGGPDNGLVWTNGATLAVRGGSVSNHFFKVNYDDLANGGHAITLTAIPEPATLLALFALGAVLVIFRRIRDATGCWWNVRPPQTASRLGWEPGAAGFPDVLKPRRFRTAGEQISLLEDDRDEESIYAEPVLSTRADPTCLRGKRILCPQVSKAWKR